MKVVKETENGEKKLYVLHEIPNLSMSEEEYRDLMIFAKEEAGNQAEYLSEGQKYNHGVLKITRHSYETMDEDKWIELAKEELRQAESNYRLYACLYKIFKKLIISKIQDEICDLKNKIKETVNRHTNEIAEIKTAIDEIQKKRKRGKR